MANTAYFFWETFRGFLQAKLMTFISIITISITLFFLGILVIVFSTIQKWFYQTTQKPGIVLYLDEKTSLQESECLVLQQSLDSLPEIVSISFVSKDNALKKFTQLYGSEMMQAVNENPLPASFEIVLDPTALHLNQLETFKNRLVQFKGIESIQYSMEWIGTVKKFKKAFISILVVIIPLLLLALHFIIANTIKLTIYARKDLITNMRYVGATDLFIEIPFILEGILQGLLGSIVALAGLVLCKMFLMHIPLYWGGWYIYSLILFCGVLFGCIGSMTAVKRFLI